MKNWENPSVQSPILESVKKRETRIHKLAEKLLNLEDARLEKYFKKSSSASVEVANKTHIVSFENFAEFLKRVRYALKQGRIEDFYHLVAIREDIKAKRPLSQQDIELLEKYGLKHWSWADVSGKVMRAIDGYDMRDTEHMNTEIKGYISKSLFTEIGQMNIGNSVVDTIVLGSIFDSTIRGYWNISGNTVWGYILDNTVGDSIFDNTVGGNISWDDISWDDIKECNISWNDIKGDNISWNKDTKTDISELTIRRDNHLGYGPGELWSWMFHF